MHIFYIWDLVIMAHLILFFLSFAMPRKQHFLICWSIYLLFFKLPSVWSIFKMILSTAVQCPANSNGMKVAVGCPCNAGFSGAVVATAIAPFFNSTCQGIIPSSRASLYNLFQFNLL